MKILIVDDEQPARTRLRGLPQLRFVHDQSLENALRLTELIDDAVATDKKREN